MFEALFINSFSDIILMIDIVLIYWLTPGHYISLDMSRQWSKDKMHDPPNRSAVMHFILLKCLMFMAS